MSFITRDNKVVELSSSNLYGVIHNAQQHFYDMLNGLAAVCPFLRFKFLIAFPVQSAPADSTNPLRLKLSRSLPMGEYFLAT